jgi:alpha-beta hydrolase superfamily lysophospholipase
VVCTFTAGDGYCWHYRHYSCPGPAASRARVVCLHGIQSHGGWYENSCTRLSQEGFEVFFLDRRGSGLNDQARGDTPSFRRLLDDLAEFLQRLRSQQSGESPGRPVFLLAISWGGKLAAALPRYHPGLIQGLALLCPGFFPRVRPSRKDQLRIAWSYLVSPRRLFPIPLSDPELFTASPRWQQFLRDDALSLHRATARFLVHSRRLDAYLRLAPSHVTVPVLLLLAGQDRIIQNEQTRRFVESFAAADREVIEYPEAHHTLEFESQPHRYLDDLLRWLKRLA